MPFSILDGGNLVASFDQVGAAHEAFERLAAANVDTSGRLLLVQFDADGQVVAEHAPGELPSRGARG